MSGFDKSIFVSLSQSIEEELTCGICLNILNNPMTTPCCRHSYCKQCILQSLRMSTNPQTCPNDRKKLLFKDLIPASRIVANIIDKQEVYCDFKSYGCPQIITLDQLSTHKIQCMFDPNKSYDKCCEALKGLNENIEKIKRKMRKEDYESLKKQLDVCQRELKLLGFKNTKKTVFIKPNTEEFKKQVIESAKNNVENSEIISCNISLTHIDEQKFKKKVTKKCKEAILQSDDYQQISQLLVESFSLSEEDYQWTAFVYPKNSAHHSISGSVYKIELCFGDLCLVLSGQYKDENYQEDDDDDHYLDNSLNLWYEVDDYDGYEDQWEDWRTLSRY